MNRKIIYMALFILCLLTLFSSCRKKMPDRSGPVEELRALVVYISGDADVVRKGNRERLDIGSVLFQGDLVHVCPDSCMEIQLADSAVVRIEDDTSFLLSSLNKTGKANKIFLKVAAGTVVQKVVRLSVMDDYTVQVRSKAFGVRGTQFLAEIKGGRAAAAVKEGKIALVPDPEKFLKLKEKSASAGREIEAAVAGLDDLLPCIGAGSGISVDDALFSEAEKAVSEIDAVLDRALDKKINRKEALLDIEEQKKIVSGAGEKVKTFLSKTDLLNEERLSVLDSMEIIPAQTRTKEITLRALPEDASLYIEDKYAGKKELRLLTAEGKIIKAAAEAEGYIRGEILIDTDSDETSYTLALEPLPPASGHLDIKTFPPDCEIKIGGKYVGRGVFSSAFPAGTLLNVEISKPEYEKSLFTVKIDERGTAVKNVTLYPLPVPYSYDIAPGKEIYKIVSADGNYGTLYGDGSAEIFSSKWETMGRYDGPFFDIVAGEEKFAALSEKGIAVISPGESGYAGLFKTDFGSAGFSGDSLLYINENKIAMADMVSGALKELSVPDDIVMQPALYGGFVLSLSEKGILHFIDIDTNETVSSVPLIIGDPGRAASLISGDRGFFYSSQGLVAAVDLKEKNVIWSVPFEKSGKSLPCMILSEDKLYLYAEEGGILEALSSSDGKALFSLSGVAVRPLALKGLLYYAEGGSFVMYDGSSPAKKYDTGKKITALDLYGEKIAAGTSEGTVLIINPEGALFKK